MAQIFSPRSNVLSRLSLLGLIVVASGAITLVMGFERSPLKTNEGLVYEQPVPFSHDHHTAAMGIDCRYCHTSVERAASAGMPPTETCMNCHKMIWQDSPMLEPVRASFRDDQPIIEPLFGGKTPVEMMALLLGRGTEPVEQLVRETWRGFWDGSGSFDSYWRRLLHDGLDPATAAAPRTASADRSAAAAAALTLAKRGAAGLELQFRPDPTVGDGAQANNTWLQECPKPLTKLTWDNALLLAPATARRLGLGDLVQGDDQAADAPRVLLTVAERALELPVWVLPGQAEDSLTLHLGYGRWRAGRVADGLGFDANPLLTSSAPWNVGAAVSVTPIAGTYQLASTQDHHNMEGRNLVRGGTLAGYRDFLVEHVAGGGHGADERGAAPASGQGAQYLPVHHTDRSTSP